MLQNQRSRISPDSTSSVHYRFRLIDVRVERWPGVARLSVTGELDVSGVPALRRALDSLSPQAGSTLTIDLAGLTFVDSTGIAPILETRDRWRTANAGFVIRNPSHPVRRLMELLESVEEAKLDSRRQVTA